MSLTDSRAQVLHVVRGVLVRPSETDFASSKGNVISPALDLDALVWTRSEPVPAADTPIAEIIELLAAVGDRLRRDEGGYRESALRSFQKTTTTSTELLGRAYEGLWRNFDPDQLRFQVETELGGADLIDGWRGYEKPDGSVGSVRAAPSRLVHIMAGNGPGVAAMTVVRGALTKSANLLKLPSNDLFTAPMILRHLIDEAPDHAVTRSFSSVYWQGGDESVESVLLNPLWFDKIIAWGGETAIRSAARWLGPGLELISFDPKNSISLIGIEAFQSDATLREAVSAAATDATVHDQDACTASRFQFVEGDVGMVDRFCELLVTELNVSREKSSSSGPAVPEDVREEIEAVRGLEPEYRVWGRFDGTGMVVRSDEPVGFYPSGKVVNVVPVDSLALALRHVSVATGTVGVYPSSRRSALRDLIVSAGAQRVATLGDAGQMASGLPHDGFFPLARFVRWVRDD